MIVTIHQPQYLPWLGYFDKARRADIFILLDNVQFKKNDWQNRNRIRTPQGWQWLTVPVLHDFGQTILEVKINNNSNWRENHLKALQFNYNKAAHFKNYINFFEEVYSREWTYLSEINIFIFEKMMEWFGLTTKIVRASQYDVCDDSTQRLIDLCKRLNAQRYLSGVDGRKYLDFQKFKDNHIEIETQNFHHPVYPQLWAGKNNDNFISHLSSIDILFNHGSNSINIISSRQDNDGRGKEGETI